MNLDIKSWFRRRRELSLVEVKREEIKLGIRENQTITKLEKLEKEREEIFAKGSKIKSPSRRRQLARLYDVKSGGVKMLERELNVLSKELTTISALRVALERRESAKEGIGHLLNRVDEAELVTLLEDDKITQEMYVEKLNEALSTVTEGSRHLFEDLGKEGDEIMQVWQKMDDGEIESFEDGLKEADKAVRITEKGDAEAETE
ncbi:MAG TPA: hypothetical protein VGK61_00930 [Planctomycetota bacterium]